MCVRRAPGTTPVQLPLLPDQLDKRTAVFKAFDSIRTAVISDLGGDELIGEVMRQLIDRFATLSLWLSMMDAKALGGDEIDIEVYGRAAGTLKRLGDSIGLKRQARELAPSVDAYLAAMARKSAAGASDATDATTNHPTTE